MDNETKRHLSAWSQNPLYEPKNLEQKLGYLLDKCGGVMVAAGKSIRWGFESSNPELPPDDRETNREWLLRELCDLEQAIALVRDEVDSTRRATSVARAKSKDLKKELRALAKDLTLAIGNEFDFNPDEYDSVQKVTLAWLIENVETEK